MNQHSRKMTEVTVEGSDLIRLWLRLLSCAKRIEDQVQSRLRARFRTSLARFDYLAQLDRAGGGPLTMTELGQRLMVSGGNMTGLTDRLEREGLVERRGDPADRRVQRISLTPRGRALFTEMARVHRDWIIDILQGLDKDSVEQLMAGLALVKASVDASETNPGSPAQTKSIR
jgi:DNA-binding MarR family transcriptional regulator